MNQKWKHLNISSELQTIFLPLLNERHIDFRPFFDLPNKYSLAQRWRDVKPESTDRL